MEMSSSSQKRWLKRFTFVTIQWIFLRKKKKIIRNIRNFTTRKYILFTKVMQINKFIFSNLLALYLSFHLNQLRFYFYTHELYTRLWHVFEKIFIHSSGKRTCQCNSLWLLWGNFKKREFEKSLKKFSTFNSNNFLFF